MDGASLIKKLLIKKFLLEKKTTGKKSFKKSFHETIFHSDPIDILLIPCYRDPQTFRKHPKKNTKLQYSRYNSIQNFSNG